MLDLCHLGIDDGVVISDGIGVSLESAEDYTGFVCAIMGEQLQE